MKKSFLTIFVDKLLQSFPFIIVFIASIYKPRDADIGWILKYGEYFVKHHQILYENTFSQMMPDYRWVNHSWLTDILNYFIFSNFGFLGLSLLGAVTLTLVFYFFSKAFNLTLWEKAFIFPFLIFYENTVNASSFRPQLLSFLLLGILFYLLSLYENGNRRKLFFVIPLFLLWANIHGLYILGLILYVLWFLIKNLERFFLHKTSISQIIIDSKLPLVVFFLSIGATLINPFGYGIYSEAFRHFFNPWQRYIIEWQPLVNSPSVLWKHIVLAALVTMGILSLIFTKKLKNRLNIGFIFSILYVLTFSMRRYAWPTYYMSIPFLQPVVNMVKPGNANTEKRVAFSFLLLIFMTTILVKSPFNQYTKMSWETFCELRRCSSKASAYLIKNNLQKEKLFTLYDWGGWLIWNYPEIKPTIDGRMHLWKDEKGYSAFSQYYPLEQTWKGYDIDKTDYNVAYISVHKPIFKRLMKLTDEGTWNLRYRDENAAIFQRVSN